MFYEEIPVNSDTIFKLPPSIIRNIQLDVVEKIEENNNMDILSLCSGASSYLC